MEQLEIKHLGRRLAYGLKFKGNEGSMIYTLTNLDYKDPSKNLYSDGFGNECVLFNTKPILRNCADLTKEITHKGKKFVPLVELYEISVAKIYGYVPEYKILLVEAEEPTFGLIVKENESKDRNGFTLNTPYEYGFRFEFDLTIDNERNTRPQCSLNQFELFEKLLEWQFRIDEPEGTWIDVNTLPKNPYE